MTAARTHREGARVGALRLTGWCGDIEHRVLVIGETPKRYRITLPEGAGPIRLPGGRVLGSGETALVPKYAVKTSQPPQSGAD